MAQSINALIQVNLQKKPKKNSLVPVPRNAAPNLGFEKAKVLASTTGNGTLLVSRVRIPAAESWITRLVFGDSVDIAMAFRRYWFGCWTRDDGRELASLSVLSIDGSRGYGIWPGTRFYTGRGDGEGSLEILKRKEKGKELEQCHVSDSEMENRRHRGNSLIAFSDTRADPQINGPIAISFSGKLQLLVRVYSPPSYKTLLFSGKSASQPASQIPCLAWKHTYNGAQALTPQPLCGGS